MKSVLISKSEYARRRGCRPSAVTRAIAAGRITSIDGKIVPVACDAQWLANSRSRIGSKPSKAVRSPEARAQADADGETQDVLISRAQREQAEARIAELTLGQLNGTLIERAACERAVFEAARGLRDGMANCAGHLGATVAGLNTAATCERAIREVHIRLLADFVHTLNQKLGLPAGPAPGAPAPAEGTPAK